ncbi:hypothetical protein GHT09_017247 [Marmota monax]|uniref:Uncharacterized protein n=1 Tax=Marmota monax TaxID=9995 RepID=A0A834Q940_MARMO|nr:hypothetical protein GHT09_017247 [Marmota monax]
MRVQTIPHKQGGRGEGPGSCSCGQRGTRPVQTAGTAMELLSAVPVPGVAEDTETEAPPLQLVLPGAMQSPCLSPVLQASCPETSKRGTLSSMHPLCPRSSLFAACSRYGLL